MRRGVGVLERLRLAPHPIDVELLTGDLSKPDAAAASTPTLKSLPPMATWIPLSRNFRAQDQKNMEFTPYFGDQDACQEKIFGDLFDFEARQRAIDEGPKAIAKFRSQKFHRCRAEIIEAIATAVRTPGSAAAAPAARAIRRQEVVGDDYNQTNDFRSDAQAETSNASETEVDEEANDFDISKAPLISVAKALEQVIGKVAEESFGINLAHTDTISANVRVPTYFHEEKVQ